MEKEKKRKVSSIFRKILDIDVYISNALVKSVERFLPLRQLVVHYKVLEISCHGIPWITGLLAFIWILNSRQLYQMQVNLLLGILLDIFFVAILKAAVRRRRPAKNGDFLSLGPDKYSFPSGHASRVAFVVYFFLNIWPISLMFVPALLCWAFCVCCSRLLMRRHHLLDIIVGVVLGICEGMLVNWIYLEKETCIRLVSWITEEKMDGAEYDI